MIRKAVFAVTLLVNCFILPVASMAEVLKREPPMGALKEGQRVVVDDGRCPAGQVSEIIGGNHVKVGGTKRTERTRRCISGVK